MKKVLIIIAIAALGACAQQEPITDDDASEKWERAAPAPKAEILFLECASKPGLFYRPGHEILCKEEPQQRRSETFEDTVPEQPERPEEEGVWC